MVALDWYIIFCELPFLKKTGVLNIIFNWELEIGNWELKKNII